ncbi:Galactoside 2-alpha-L-fucosyltransferase 3 [Mizuhopecten yessoensis]|uniref:L-Fucosyltransferase n=1 Tax=Mizuhopecten yessoensis TaxID=6573 RepID=A0A210PPB8_MIZYE|nr:Galactoside 2-alpha-L-fucosyltransferase 3 [Mizuhopecten yessoensis]
MSVICNNGFARAFTSISICSTKTLLVLNESSEKLWYLKRIGGIRLTNPRCPPYQAVINGKWFKKLFYFLLFLGFLYTFFIITQCWKIYLYDMMGWEREKFICVKFRGRLANQMFDYAFLYAYAHKKGLSMIVPPSDLTKAFGIQPKTGDQYGFSRYTCWCFWTIDDKWNCAYDSSFEELEKNKDLSFRGFFQSWKYWKDYDADLRKIFVFQDDIKDKARSYMKKILKETGKKPQQGSVLVGIHIRRGDHIERSDVNYGKLVATEGYLDNSMGYFRRKYKDVLFVVISDDILWTTNTLQKYDDVYIVTGNSGEVDMCLLTLTNHTIMSVGTFGWFIGWMTNGTMIYYKNVARPGSGYEWEFGPGIQDHFLPHWIGME